MSDQPAPRHCGNLTAHEPHRAMTTPDADICLGYPDPAADQIWQDNDRRTSDRYLMITAVDVTHATARLVTYDPHTGIAAELPGTRTSRIRLSRLRPTSTGYRYIRTQAPR
ncbi:hypothetical protein ACFC34_00415 [Streptomyces sp. NPDC056053]|uniref:hypothetical protein n=1 Tax=Streptomyces sp. NPDC056053 TaxID=3345696 RepID=UPI0035D629AB